MLTDRYSHPSENEKEDAKAYREQLYLYNRIMESFPEDINGNLWTCKQMYMGPSAEILLADDVTQSQIRAACRWLAKFAGKSLEEEVSATCVKWKVQFKRQDAISDKHFLCDVEIVHRLRDEEDVCVIVPRAETKRVVTYVRLCPGDEGYEEARFEKEKEKEIAEELQEAI